MSSRRTITKTTLLPRTMPPMAAMSLMMKVALPARTTKAMLVPSIAFGRHQQPRHGPRVWNI